MGIREDYLKTAVDTMLSIDPTMDRDRVEEIISEVISEKFTDPTITMDNNVKMENFKLTLSELCDWITDSKPVVSGNATFYVQPEVLQSPVSNMLRAISDERKSIKRAMFEATGDPDKYQQLDLQQSNVKVIINAEYGATGAPTSAFYNEYSPAATTLMAQSIITTMAAFFESFVGDNMKFFHIDECMDWLRVTRSRKEKIHDWVVVPTKHDVLRRVREHFIMFNPSDNDLLSRYLENCSPKELVYIFYANNLNEFIRRHQQVSKLIHSVLSKLPNLQASEKEVPSEFSSQFKDVTDYNNYVAREMFLDPYKIPRVAEEDMKNLTTIVRQYCFVDYLTADSIVKLNNHKRNTVLLVDTDSNIINANLFISFVMGELFRGENFGRESIYNDMICANILASMLDHCIRDILDHYGRAHNANEDARSELVMKNEFFFRRFFLMNTKKRYASSIVLREGHIMVPFKTEIKGLDFIKAGVTDEVTERFTRILENNILFSEYLMLHELMRDLRVFEKEIREDLKVGGTRYLKTVNYKAEGAYKNPWSLQTFKAVMVWNSLFPGNKIYTMNKIKLVKLIVNKVSDLDVIRETFPTEYNLCLTNIFNAVPVTTPNMNDRQRAWAETTATELLKNGMKVIAIPNTLNRIPDWICPLVDYQTIISDISNSFRSVLDSFQIDEIPVKTPNGKSNLTTGLISI